MSTDLQSLLLCFVVVVIIVMAWRSMRAVNAVAVKNMQQIAEYYGFEFIGNWPKSLSFCSGIFPYEARASNFIQGIYEGEQVYFYNYIPWKEEIRYTEYSVLTVGESRLDFELPTVVVLPNGMHKASDDLKYKNLRLASPEFMNSYEVLVDKNIDSKLGGLVFQIFDLRLLDSLEHTNGLIIEVNKNSIKVVRQGVIEKKEDFIALTSLLIILVRNVKQSWGKTI